MTIKEHLVAARAKIAQGWCYGEMALNQHGESTVARDPDAVCWCVLGSLRATNVGFTFGGSAGHHALHAAMLAYTANDVKRYERLDDWNDAPGRTQEQVLALFDYAIDYVATQPN